MIKPLENILVIDFSQFLSGPSGSLRMADLGARVIKIERPGTGDISRHLYISNVKMNGDSSVFHAINRNKESFAADLKDPEDCDAVRKLLAVADVVIHNFRPGVMKRLGFDYGSVKKLKPDIIYGEITGYGEEGPWKDKPGQDLLVQSLSGLCQLSGNGDKAPVAMGISAVDILTGAHLIQGILACLLRKKITGEGGLVQVSMLESACDMQFETITTVYQDGGHPAKRSQHNNAHAYIGAPYGIYRTTDGFMALAMSSVPRLGELLKCKELLSYNDPDTWFDQREQIKDILSEHLKSKPTHHWLLVLEPADIWCAEVYNWDQLTRHEGFQALDMLQTVKMTDGYSFQTTRCPIRIDGSPLQSEKGTPRLGEDSHAIMEELLTEMNLTKNEDASS